MKFVILSVLLIAATACTSDRDIANGNSAAAGPAVVSAQSKPTNPCLNLNKATAEELIKLPGIGDVIAARIIEYRNRHGRFKRPQEIIIIEGFSERKYRAIADMVCAE